MKEEEYVRRLLKQPEDCFIDSSHPAMEDPEHWWQHRGDVRTVWSELPKIVAYACGLGAG